MKNSDTFDIKQATLAALLYLLVVAMVNYPPIFARPRASCVGWAASGYQLNLLRNVQAEAKTSLSVAVLWMYFKSDNSYFRMHSIDRIVPVLAQDSSRGLHKALRIAQVRHCVAPCQTRCHFLNDSLSFYAGVT